MIGYTARALRPCGMLPDRNVWAAKQAHAQASMESGILTSQYFTKT